MQTSQKINFPNRRRESTEVRDNEVHGMYHAIIKELGSLSPFVSKTYIYGLIRDKTKLSIRTISYILNHTPCNRRG